ncbi:ribonuclease Z [Neobacillus niacini]|uniref:MBL fold metallo-hydrolase n=1 Tax=Neobacillus niacini TaxID=86668 RepID=UPI002858CEBC|nr:MBL fold metallo-hydrolase [Neobacillus niacini]MDR7079396.1 ribonuclease Z [Neobacillus niacini]
MEAVFKVTLLGTGSPIIDMNRFGNSTLVEVDGQKILFDVGRGALLRLSQLNILPGDIDKVFFTHLHSDHLTGFPDLWLTRLKATYNTRNEPMKIWGPKGTKQMAYFLENAFSADLNSRPHTESRHIQAHDIEEGVLYDEKGLKITAFLVDHGEIKPCYGYRLDFKGKSVLISGDTRYNENLIFHAENIDVLIHEVAAADLEQQDSDRYKRVLEIHTTPEEAGDIFSRVQPKLAVYTHVVLLGGMSEEEARLVERTKKYFSGEVVVGKDLMAIVIGNDVKVMHSQEIT